MCGDRVQRAVGVESTMKRRRERNEKEGEGIDFDGGWESERGERKTVGEIHMDVDEEVLEEGEESVCEEVAEVEE